MFDETPELYKNNSKSWFSQRVTENMDSLFNVAYRLTRNTADAEDLVAETVTKAWISLSTLEDHQRFRAWIFRILHNGFISQYRKTASGPLLTPFDEPDSGQETQEVASLLIEQPNDFLSWWANPEKDFFNNLLNEDIVAAIEDLPKEFQLTVTLINVEGFTYDEAAEVLNVSPGTIRSRMNRGRTLMQKALWQHARDAGLVSNTKPTELNNER